MATIKITLNGEARDIPAETNLVGLLEVFSLPSQRIAIELNKTVIRRSAWPQSVLREGDKIEVVHFVGGG